MRKVFLLGDSIRLGYRPYAALALDDIAHVYASDDNGRFVQYTLRYVHEWAEACGCREQVDVVHWNNGLWDACLWDGEPLTPLASYRAGLLRLARHIQALFPNARLIFALTTPVAPGHDHIRNEDILRMNQAARETLTPLGVRINDLHTLVLAHPEYICEDRTHMTPEGRRALGQAVANAVREIIGTEDESLCGPEGGQRP